MASSPQSPLKRRDADADKTDGRERVSTAPEDYLEIILRLEAEIGTVRISDIAERLGVKPPPVTRAVQALQPAGLRDS